MKLQKKVIKNNYESMKMGLKIMRQNTEKKTTVRCFLQGSYYTHVCV